MLFYPDDGPVPVELRTEHLLLRSLGPEHVERDYDAFMSSRERLLVWSGGSWPAADFTLALNMDDMHFHRREHEERIAFTFTVMSPDEARCEGCTYTNSWDVVARRMGAEIPEIARDYDGLTSYWVRDSALARDLDKELLRGLIDWFAGDWSFGRALFFANSGQVRDLKCFEEAGLTRLATITGSANPGTFHIYG